MQGHDSESAGYRDPALPGQVRPPQVPGRYVIIPVDGIDGWPYYWHAYLGDRRINGGLAQDHLMAVQEAKRVIALTRRNEWLQENYFDYETGMWYKKGELPPC